MVLAAGRGERFGDRTKQLALLDGEPLVGHVVRAAIAGGVRHLVVVVGHDGPAVARAARVAAGEAPERRSGHPGSASGDDRVCLWTVDNPRHAEGQSTSLVAGIRAAFDIDGAEAAVLLLADQPRIRPSAVRDVADAVLSGAVAARARYLDGASHPVGFSRSRWTELLEVEGDAGARHLLRTLPVVEVPVDAHRPDDVDTAEDLLRLAAPPAETLPSEAVDAPLPGARRTERPDGEPGPEPT